MLATKIQISARFIIRTILSSLLLVVFATASASAAKPAIPPGCPGSKTPISSIPPSERATFEAACKKIPAGCPGSSQALPKKAPAASSCKYAGTPESKSSASKSPKTTTPASTTASNPATDVCCANCGAAASKQTDCSQVTDQAANSGNCANVSKCDLISRYVNPLVDFLSAAVGIVVVASIIIGGIQYASSGGDTQKVSAAKKRIQNAIVALVAFIFLLAFLNFIIPGGV